MQYAKALLRKPVCAGIASPATPLSLAATLPRATRNRQTFLLLVVKHTRCPMMKLHRPQSGVTRGHASIRAIRLRSTSNDNPAEEPRFRFHTVLNDKSVGTVGIRTGSTYDDAAERSQKATIHQGQC